MLKRLYELGLQPSPELGPVLELAAAAQNYRKERSGRTGRVTRSTLLYALARIHPEIREAVFADQEHWQKYVLELDLAEFESRSATAGEETDLDLDEAFVLDLEDDEPSTSQVKSPLADEGKVEELA
jgi:hypothetical protein